MTRLKDIYKLKIRDSKDFDLGWICVVAGMEVMVKVGALIIVTSGASVIVNW